MSIDQLRIYLTGSHSTGKTTLARWIADRYQMPLITEVVRGLLAARETTLDAVRLDVGASNALQTEIFHHQLADEARMTASQGFFVSDRSLDFLAYTAAWASNADSIASHPDFARYVAGLKAPEAVVFFVRPHKELVTPDGTRSAADLRWEEVLRIDAMVECLLECHGIPYVPVSMMAMRDRVKLVERVIGLAAVSVEKHC